MAPTQVSSSSPDKTSGRRSLRKSDIRLAISVPALLVLLTIAIGVADYLAVLSASQQMGKVAGGTPDAVIALQSQVLDFLLIFSLIAFVVGLALVWTILRPIRHLAKVAQHIVTGTPLNEPFQFKGAFEIDQLNQSFNSIIGFLQASIDQRNEMLDESIAAGSMLVDETGRILSINPRGLEILCAEETDLIGHTLDQVRHNLPDLAPVFLGFCEEHLSAAPDATTGDTALGTRLEGEKPLSVAYSLLDDPQARKVVFHFRDLSRIQNLNLLFSRTDQLAALGTFTMGLSHELRNPLAAIKGTAQLMNETGKGNEEFGPYLDRMVRESDRLDKLVRELYDFSRSPAGDKTPHDLNDIVRETLSEVTRGLNPDDLEDRELLEEYATGLPPVIVQRDRIGRAIGNVLINAFEHTPKGETLRLRTVFHADGKPARVALEVTNTGSTIPPESLERVFEPFFSTKTRGTGLGLAIAYQIAAQNGCLLSASSNDRTVTFQFAFRHPAPQSVVSVAGDAA